MSGLSRDYLGGSAQLHLPRMSKPLIISMIMSVIMPVNVISMVIMLLIISRVAQTVVSWLAANEDQKN